MPETAKTPALEPAQTKRGPASALINLTNIKKPILLIGDVGVGKTTFVEHLFLVDWADKREQLIVLRIDLADKPSDAGQLASTVYTEIERSLLDNYEIDITEDRFVRGVYHGQLMRLRKSPVGRLQDLDPTAYLLKEIERLGELQADKDSNLNAVFHHLVRGRRKIVVVVFDNVDQRSDELQRKTFLQAQIAASKWDVFVIVALRPSTLAKSKLGGDVAGYHPRAFTISPPRFDNLINARIYTGIQMLSGRLPIPSLGSSIKLQADQVCEYLSVLSHSFSHNSSILQFVEDMSNGNMRLALDYVVDFMSCGHVDAAKILRIWHENGGNYVIPFHEFVRGVMYAEREYYSSKDASVLNLFETNSGDPRESFAVPAVVEIVYLHSDDSDEPYISVGEVEDLLLEAGYSVDQAKWAVARCLSGLLIESNNKTSEYSPATHVRSTPRGCYYYTTLMRTFVYLDAISIDTPISDPDYLARIRDEVLLDRRVGRVVAFVEYLESVYDSYPRLQNVFTLSTVVEALQGDLEHVRDSARRAARRSRNRER